MCCSYYKEYLVEEINIALKGILSKSNTGIASINMSQLRDSYNCTTYRTSIKILIISSSKSTNQKLLCKKALDEAQILFDSLMQKYFG